MQNLINIDKFYKIIKTKLFYDKYQELKILYPPKKLISTEYLNFPLTQKILLQTSPLNLQVNKKKINLEQFYNDYYIEPKQIYNLFKNHTNYTYNNVNKYYSENIKKNYQMVLILLLIKLIMETETNNKNYATKLTREITIKNNNLI